MTPNATEAAHALEAMRASRERLAAEAGCPPERHLVFAGLLGVLVASQAAPPLGALAIEAATMLAVPLILLWDRRRTGMFINGYRNGRTRPLTFALLVVALAFGALGVWMKHGLGLWWGPIPCGVLVAVLAYAGSAYWMRVYRRELSETP